MNKIILATCAVGLMLPACAYAADLGAEINTAQTHAGLAAKADTIDTVHMHLHHTINCLVGPKGSDFDAKQMNPCAQSGDGAIPDSTDAAQKAKLEMALNQAKAGISATDMTAAKKDATDASMTIAGAK